MKESNLDAEFLISQHIVAAAPLEQIPVYVGEEHAVLVELFSGLYDTSGR